MRKTITRGKVKKLLPSCRTFREIADRIGCSRMTVSHFFAQEANADLAEEFAQHMEQLLDIAEEKLEDRILRDDFESLKFFLKTKGQSRGYREQPNILIPQGMRIQIESVGYNPQDYIDLQPEPVKQITRHAKTEQMDAE